MNKLFLKNHLNVEIYFNFFLIFPQQSSVLQKATKYGQVVRRMSSSSQSSDVSKPLPKPSSQTPNIMRPQSMQIMREPPQAVIRSSLYSQQSSYDVPKPPGI